MSYHDALRSVFPWRYESTPSTIRYFLRTLTEPNRENAPLGTSSFAVVPISSGLWCIWLSDISKVFLVKELPHIQRNLIETKFEIL